MLIKQEQPIVKLIHSALWETNSDQCRRLFQIKPTYVHNDTETLLSPQNCKTDHPVTSLMDGWMDGRTEKSSTRASSNMCELLVLRHVEPERKSMHDLVDVMNL